MHVQQTQKVEEKVLTFKKFAIQHMILPIFSHNRHIFFWTWSSQRETGSDIKQELFKKWNFLVFVC